MANGAGDTAEIEALLDGVRGGRADATDRLFAMLYDDFRSQAHRLLRIGPRQTLCTTELVNETWLRLSGRTLSVESRRHFFNLAAHAMRQLLIDRARLRGAGKRGDGGEALTLGAASDVAADEPFDVLALDRVMTELAATDAALDELAQMHLFEARAGERDAALADYRAAERRLAAIWVGEPPQLAAIRARIAQLGAQAGAVVSRP